jgi:hypothetical protein
MISIILPSLGRPSLLEALDSIELWPGDEILVVGELAQLNPYIRPSDVERGVRFLHCPRGHDWGSTERNAAMPLARGTHLAFLDDDDRQVPGARAAMADAVTRTPDRPVVFRMRYPDGRVLWREPAVIFGNVGTPMFFIPNVPQKLGIWGGFIGGDCAFLESVGWLRSDIIWRQDVIAEVGDDLPAHVREAS